MASPCVEATRSRSAAAAAIQALVAVIVGLTPGPGRDGFPLPGAHRAVGGVEDLVDDEAVPERLPRLPAGAERLDDVLEHRVVAVGVGLVGDGEHPARVRVGLLAEIAGRPLDEGPERASRSCPG